MFKSEKRVAILYVLLCFCSVPVRATPYDSLYRNWLGELKDAYRRDLGGGPASIPWGTRACQSSLVRAGATALKISPPALIKWQAGRVERIRSLGSQMRSYYTDIEAYKRRYGTAFFSQDSIARGAINVLLMRSLATFENQEARADAAMNALALLHPITDGAIDSRDFDPEILTRISQTLEGNTPPATSPFERIVIDFIGDIYRSYPRKNHPTLDWLLNKLHAVQRQSAVQKGSPDEDELLDITFYKGGLTFVAASYIALGSLNLEQQKFFFKAGALFQALDDLMDISQDIGDGIQTLWTRALSAQQSVEEPLLRLLQTRAENDRDSADLTRVFASGNRIRAIYRASFDSLLIHAFGRNTDRRVLSAIDLLGRHTLVSPRTFAYTEKCVRAFAAQRCAPDEIFRRLVEAHALF